MRYVEEFLSLEKTDDRDENATRPKLAAMALMELSLTKDEEPTKHKKGLPIFEHLISYRDGTAMRRGEVFSARVRHMLPLERPYNNPAYYARLTASFTLHSELGLYNFEFSEGSTSISNCRESSTTTDSGLWVVANTWRPVDHSVRDYLRLQYENIQEYGIPTA